MKEPESMDDILFFTNRTVGAGKIRAWAEKPSCLKCKKGKMGKPISDKGTIQRRSEEYVCKECGFTCSKEEAEENTVLSVIYTCPHCRREGEATAAYRRKTWQGVQAYVFECQYCKKEVGITKKLKEPKKKSVKSMPEQGQDDG